MLHVKLSCQARTKDPNLQTESRFPVGAGVGSPLTENPHCYVSDGKGALNQQTAGWVFPGTAKPENIQNFCTQNQHYSQYLIWKQDWKPLPQFNLDQALHLLWDTPLPSLVWFSRNNMVLWSKIKLCSSWWKCCFGWIVAVKKQENLVLALDRLEFCAHRPK